MGVTRKELVAMCKILGLRVKPGYTKDVLSNMIKVHEEQQKIKILCSGKDIKYIYHTADIHIRCLDRHHEYTEVFDNLCKVLQNNGSLDNSVLVICGDIFHNRGKLVSECIKLFDEFIEKLTKILDVIMILGNHDTFIHNDRLDTISGIVDIKVYNNFYFLKNSGIYKYNNIDFVVSSLLDNQFIRHSDVPITPGTTCIALYHGAISGSRVSTNMSFSGDSLFTVGDFKGYDIVLLGDVHLKQHLTPTIAYPGSLIQQNYKEELVHGILKWNVLTKSSEFLPVHNNYGYITIDVHQNNSDVVFPKKSRIKLLHGYNSSFDFDSLKKDIASKTEILSITKEIKVSNHNSTNEIQNEIVREDLEIDLFTKLLSDLTPLIKQDLLEVHEKFSSVYNDQQETFDSISWKISELEFMNVFIYGDSYINKIKFTENTVTGILSANASGKSSIFNTIMYCLFGNSYMKSKNYSNRNIINKNEKTFYIKMTIVTENGITYTIEKNGKNKSRKSETGIEETVTFKQIVFDKVTNLTDSNKIDTVTKIHKILGLSSKDTFILTNVLSNVHYTSLLNMTAADISDVFSKLFNMQKYKEIYQKVLKKYKDTVGTIKSLEGHISGLQLSKKDSEVLIQQKDSLTLEVQASKEELAEIEQELNTLTEQEIELGKVTILPRPGNSLQRLTESLELFQSKVITDQVKQEFQSRIIEISDTITSTIQSKIHIKKVVSDAEYNKLQKGEQFSIQEFVVDLRLYNNCNRYCDTVTIPKDLYDDLLELLVELDSDVYLNNIIKIRDYKSNLTHLKDNAVLDECVKDLRIKLESIKKQLQDSNQNEKHLELIKKDIIECETYTKNEDKIQLKTKLLTTKNVLLSKKESTNSSILKLHTKIGQINNSIDNQIIIDKNITNTLQELCTFKKDEILYKTYKDIMNDKCLPKMVLTTTIKKIEMDANIMIYKLIGLYVLFNVEISDGKWEITIKKNNMILGVEHISGFERLVINIGLKIAIDKYQCNSSIKFFAIDECFDCISDDNFHKIDDIFSLLKENYHNVLIISHNDNLKNKVDNRINIVTDFVCSKIS